MKDMTFEQYWEKNEEKYKQNAMNDFDRLQKGKFEGRVNIGTDDDFSLDIDYDFSLYAQTREELVTKIIEKLNSAKVVNGKTWSVTYADGSVKAGDKSDIWNEIRDEAIMQLQEEYGSDHICIGGNQTIDINIFELILDFD